MTNRLLVILILTMVILAGLPSRPLLAQESTSVSGEIRQLGRGNDDRQIVGTLAKAPRLAVQLLIDELRPVNETRILASEKRPEAEHVLWSIRALRYLTGGKDFCGQTRHEFDKSEFERNRKYWLYSRHRTCVSFFAMWPSRGTEYVAPQDAQNEIILKWRDWFKDQGASFDYKPLLNPKPEEWLW
jgi:hypothetical protein